MPTFPHEFTLNFAFDPIEQQYVVTGEILDLFFPDEFFGGDLASVLEELAEAFYDVAESQEE